MGRVSGSYLLARQRGSGNRALAQLLEPGEATSVPNDLHSDAKAGPRSSARAGRVLQRDSDDAPPPPPPPATTAEPPSQEGPRFTRGVQMDVRERTEAAAKSRADEDPAKAAGGDSGASADHGAPPHKDREKVNAKRQELEPAAPPVAEKAAEKHGDVSKAAGETKRAAETSGGGGKAGAQPKETGHGKGAPGKGAHGKGGGHAAGAAQAAEQAAGLAQAAFAAADAQSAPTPPPTIVPPKPVEPVDAGGRPLPAMPEGEGQIMAIAAKAQHLRQGGFSLRTRASGAQSDASVLQGNIARARGGIADSEGGVAQLHEHLEYRRGVVGQARQALASSEQKAATVAAQAPEFGSRAHEKESETKERAGEATNIAGESASAQPDDDEAAAKSREQSQGLTSIGSDLGSVNDAFAQTGAGAAQLGTEAAQAKSTNANSKTKIGQAEAALGQTESRLGELRRNNEQARTQIASVEDAPSQVRSEAQAIDDQGSALIDASVAIEARLHSAQEKHAASMQAVPKLEEPAARQPGTGGVIARTPATGYEGRFNPNLGGAASEALPTWLTGSDEAPSQAARQQALLREQQRRQAEIAEIGDLAGKPFDQLTAAEKRDIALTLFKQHIFDSVGSVNWPNLGKHILLGIVHPGVSLMGVVSGFSTMVGGLANLFSSEQWARNPVGNLLKSAADIATGLTIILASVIGLAMSISLILWAIAIVGSIFSFGAVGAALAPIIAFLGGLIATLTPWTIWIGVAALALQALCFIKNLYDAGTAHTADELQRHSDDMTEDAKNAGVMAATVGVLSVAHYGGRAFMKTGAGEWVAGRVQGLGEFANVYPRAGPPAPGGQPGSTPAGGADPAASTTGGQPGPAPGTTDPAATATGGGQPGPAGGQPAPAPTGGQPAPPSGRPAPTTGTADPSAPTTGGGQPAPAPTGGQPAPASGQPAPTSGTADPTAPTSGGSQPTPAPADGQPAPAGGQPAPTSGTADPVAPTTGGGRPAPATGDQPAPATGQPAPTRTADPATPTTGDSQPTPAPTGDQPAPATGRPAPTSGTADSTAPTGDGGQPVPAPTGDRPAPAQTGGQPAPGTADPNAPADAGGPTRVQAPADTAAPRASGDAPEPARPVDPALEARAQAVREKLPADLRDDPMFQNMDPQTTQKLSTALRDDAMPGGGSAREPLARWAKEGAGGNPREFANRYEYATTRYRELVKAEQRPNLPREQARLAAARRLEQEIQVGGLSDRLQADLEAARALGAGEQLPPGTGVEDPAVPDKVRGMNRVAYETDTAEAYHARKHMSELPSGEQDAAKPVDAMNTSAMKTIREGTLFRDQVMADTGSRQLVFRRVAGDPPNQVTLEAIVYVKPDGTVVLASFGSAKVR